MGGAVAADQPAAGSHVLRSHADQPARLAAAAIVETDAALAALLDVLMVTAAVLLALVALVPLAVLSTPLWNAP